MKTIASFLFALCLVSSAYAQDTYRSDLEPVIPTPQNTWFSAGAEFSLDGESAAFTIVFGVESIVPTEARIIASSTDVIFDLGTPLIAIHSPGPWPDGYDGATMFYGAFELPGAIREDFVTGQTTLLLSGSRVGDFRGAIVDAGAAVHVPEPATLGLIAVPLIALASGRRRRAR